MLEAEVREMHKASFLPATFFIDRILNKNAKEIGDKPVLVAEYFGPETEINKKIFAVVGTTPFECGGRLPPTERGRPPSGRLLRAYRPGTRRRADVLSRLLLHRFVFYHAATFAGITVHGAYSGSAPRSRHKTMNQILIYPRPK